jgi:hypothetical protein
MVVAPPLADLRYPADQWQTVFARILLLAEKSMQNAERCDIRATVSTELGEFPPIPRVFLATLRNKKSVNPTFGWSGGTLPDASDATRTPT